MDREMINSYFYGVLGGTALLAIGVFFFIFGVATQRKNSRNIGIIGIIVIVLGLAIAAYGILTFIDYYLGSLWRYYSGDSGSLVPFSFLSLLAGVIIISVVGIFIGVWLLIRAYWMRSKTGEEGKRKLAGAILIVVSVPALVVSGTILCLIVFFLALMVVVETIATIGIFFG
jgi:uncharacterized membrane protein YidH (DUF202 family)